MFLKQRCGCVEAKSEGQSSKTPPHAPHDMPAIDDNLDLLEPPDICLLLRAHGEQRWLISEVVPVLRELEQATPASDDRHGAALAYLEVLWVDACLRAAETDTAFAKLDRAERETSLVLYERARRYHEAVCRLRNAVAVRVAEVTRRRGDVIAHGHAGS